MTTDADLNTLVVANDDLTVAEHLLAAYRMTADPFGKHLIELALIHEGRKIARDCSKHHVSPNSLERGLEGRLAGRDRS